MVITLNETGGSARTSYSSYVMSGQYLSIDAGHTELDVEFFQPEPDAPIEISISARDNTGKRQDLVLVRPAQNSDSFDLLLWEDAGDENHTRMVSVPYALKEED